MSNLTGAAMWIFRDFPTPLRPENPIPFVNQKGVVAARRHAQGKLLRFPKLLGGPADDPHLRPHLAGALGQTG